MLVWSFDINLDTHRDLNTTSSCIPSLAIIPTYLSKVGSNAEHGDLLLPFGDVSEK